MLDLYLMFLDLLMRPARKLFSSGIQLAFSLFKGSVVFIVLCDGKSGFVFHTKHTAEATKYGFISFKIDNMYYVNFRI